MTRAPGAPPAVGTELPALRLDVTATFVVATALATRDFQDVHHDRVAAVARGSKDIFLNILTTTGLVQRCVTDWAGPAAVVRAVSIRLGVPCYAGDELVLGGRVAAVEAAHAGGPEGVEVLVEVVGRCGLGDHVTGTVKVVLP
ncbi:acyl dehydratase [Pseudonocardia lacus]|uniref:acyl dehydratase n=1 Tax=Pseudonocardia lacus TaxID=2835865 RepID=UPI0027E22E60|nr:acyl dehydratase [Pseudonocardia lacus]